MASAMILSDSMLSKLSRYHIEYLKDALNVQFLETHAFRGKTALFILEKDTWVYKKLGENNYKYILVSACQNDISQTIWSGDAGAVSALVFEKVSSEIRIMADSFPNSVFIFLPLTLRSICLKKYTRFPDSKSKEYIEKVNDVIKKLTSMMKELEKEFANFWAVASDYLWTDPAALTIDDGIHLSPHGLDKYLTESISIIRPRIKTNY